MNNNSPMLLGEKIKQIRVFKGFSQGNLAHAANTSVSYISRLERGEADCSDEMLAAIQKCLEVENAPLREAEIKLYKEQILILNDLLIANRMDEAKVMCSKLAPILKLPFERDLSLLYTMLEIKLLGCEFEYSIVEEALRKVEPLLDDASIEVLHLYHSIKGGFCNYKGDYIKSLQHFLYALDYESETLAQSPNLLLNIGIGYYNIGKPFHAIAYLERARASYSGDRTHFIVHTTERMLGICYLYLGDYKKAKEFTERSLAQANRVNDAYDVMDALHRLSSISLMMKDYDKCLHFCEQMVAMDQTNDDPAFTIMYESLYLFALINKAHCFMETHKNDKFYEVLEQGIALAQPDQRVIIRFETLRHLSTLKDSQSQNYLENIALPSLMCPNSGDILTALYVCDRLEAHYSKNGATRKANAIVRISRDIYKNMISSDI